MPKQQPPPRWACCRFRNDAVVALVNEKHGAEAAAVVAAMLIANAPFESGVNEGALGLGLALEGLDGARRAVRRRVCAETAHPRDGLWSCKANLTQ